MISEQRKHAVVDIASSGDNTIIDAPTGTSEYIAIDCLYIVPAAADGIIFKTGSTALTGLVSLPISQPLSICNPEQDPDGVLRCGVNEAFIINCSTSDQVSGYIKYRIVNR